MHTGGSALYQELPTGSLETTGMTSPTLKHTWHCTYNLSIARSACTITNVYGELFSWQFWCTHPSCSTQQVSTQYSVSHTFKTNYRCNLFQKMTINLSYTHIHKQEATLHDRMKTIEYNIWQIFHGYYMLISWHAVTDLGFRCRGGWTPSSTSNTRKTSFIAKNFRGEWKRAPLLCKQGYEHLLLPLNTHL
jgi:hypothetical protein